MKLQKITNQNRRDFIANYVCEYCGYVEEDVRGYDDTHYHNNVIPNMTCTQCGKNAPNDALKSSPKYPDHIVV